ncbi:MAG: hypothetical protein MO846_00580 [Candidatus Devosia symbiotica]|nr:hypothetical protein [Candidatus Devosia symbiotica]
MSHSITDPDPCPDIDPVAPLEIIPQPEPALPQAVDPVPPYPQELPNTPQLVEDPAPGQPDSVPGDDRPPTWS